MTWLQIHPALGAAGRIQAGSAQGVDAENFDVGRRFEPDTDIDRDQLDARMAADPPMSVAEFLALVAAEMQTQLGYQVTVHEPRPAPEPPAEPEPEVEP